MMFAIETMNLTKKFGDFTALNNVSLKIKKGEIFGLLGPNGAGKTTMISILATLAPLTSGTATLLGKDVSLDSVAVRQEIGIVFQDPSLDADLSARENLDFHARLYQISSAERKEKIDTVLGVVDLSDKADQLVKTFSGGMKRRLEIARAMLHTPKIIFLDEPTLGLDVQTRRKLWDYIRLLANKHNITVILTTHYLEEADSLCDRIAVIDHGEIKALDTPKKLKETLGGDVISVSTDQRDELEKALTAKKIGNHFSQTDGMLHFAVENGPKSLPKVAEIAKTKKIEMHSLSIKQPSLEDVFIQLTGHAIRDEGSNSKDAARQMAKVRGM